MQLLSWLCLLSFLQLLNMIQIFWKKHIFITEGLTDKFTFTDSTGRKTIYSNKFSNDLFSSLFIHETVQCSLIISTLDTFCRTSRLCITRDI